MNDKCFQTTDLPLSAYFLLKKLTFLGLERKDEKALWFVFSPYDKCQKLSNDFFSGKGNIVAIDYSNALRRAKDILFNHGRK